MNRSSREILSSEKGSVIKDWGGRCRVALCCPNEYRVGMGNLGFQCVYHLVNNRPDFLCERFFTDEGLSARSLESGRGLEEFEIVAFSLPFELDYPNVLSLLGASSVPMTAGERKDGDPLVICGGAAAFMNPAPLSPFFDAVFIGEAEEHLAPFLDLVSPSSDSLPRARLLEEVARLPGFYVPSIHAATPRRVFCEDFSAGFARTRIHAPLAEFGSLFVAEVSRGCERGCGFCAAGRLYKPARNAPAAAFLDAVEEEGRGRTVGLMGTDLSNNPDLLGILEALRAKGIGASVSSIRLDALAEELCAAMAACGVRTLTIAPEAGTERLRRRIGKPFTEDRIVEAVRAAFRGGVHSLKLYFMVGLPGETPEDVEAIPELLRKLAKAKSEKGKQRLSVAVSAFVPKPGTPFAKEKMEPENSLAGKIKALRKSISPFCDVEIESPRQSTIQAALAGGSAETGLALLRAYREGKKPHP